MLSHGDNITTAAMVSRGAKAVPQLQVTSQYVKQGYSTPSGGN